MAKKPVHCDHCPEPVAEFPNGLMVCPCDCHPYGLSWRQERKRRRDEFYALLEEQASV